MIHRFGPWEWPGHHVKHDEPCPHVIEVGHMPHVLAHPTTVLYDAMLS